MDRRTLRLPGFAMLLLLLLIVAAVVTVFVRADQIPQHLKGWVLGGSAVIGGLLVITIASGMLVLSPNTAAVVQFFGKYSGTISRPGYHWTVPFSVRRTVSLRVRNFETARLKVSDADGNPVEIAAVVVWKVVDAAKAVFAVDSYGPFVSVQAETAVRHLATTYPYESHGGDRPSLREGVVVSAALSEELGERVERAGVAIVESRVTHLAYAPEIAQAMLARQQASAIVAARSTIVEGAVGMVQQALQRLREEDVVNLDEERKAQMVSNLLVVLCGDRAAQPVVNTGTLYG